MSSVVPDLPLRIEEEIWSPAMQQAKKLGNLAENNFQRRITNANYYRNKYIFFF